MIAFAHSVRFNEHGKTTKSALLVGTVKSIIGDVAKTFRENFRRYPTRDTKKTKDSVQFPQ